MEETSNKISTKDLSFFEDMFNWNVNCYNAFAHFLEEVEDQDVVELISDIKNMHKESCEYILGLIKE